MGVIGRGWHHVPLVDGCAEEALEEARLLERVPARQQGSLNVSKSACPSASQDHGAEKALEEARLLERVPARQQFSMPVSNARQQVSKPVSKATRQQVSITVCNLSIRIMAEKKRSRKLDSSSAYLPVSKSGISYRRALAVLR